MRSGQQAEQRPPAAATARMTARMRLTPRAQKVQRQRDDQHRVEHLGHSAHLTRRTMPNPESRQAATRRTGTWVSRRRAMIDSTIPTATATSEHPAEEHRPVEPGAARCGPGERPGR